MKKQFCTFTLLICSLIVFSQTIIEGRIIDEDNVGLENANIIVKSIDVDNHFNFTVSKQKGFYKLELQSNRKYKVVISYIGYITLKKEINITKGELNYNFMLLEDPNELKEVVINYKEPIKVKKDTIQYRVNAFVDGKERKLRQVLKKLPGVEIDRKGNVTVKGKKVTKLLVEDKVFFTGDSKLAVNNLPANVIEEIQVIEDYHESTLMKGLMSSSDVAMNIKLKEGKKEFYFGDLEVGGGMNDTYVIHPTLFKYGKKTSINFIGDINNSGGKSFSLKDYINYEGGLDLNNFSTMYNSPIMKLLREKDFIKNKHKFWGLNLHYTLSKKTEWNLFFINLLDNKSNKTEQNQNYLLDNINENRIEFGGQKQKMFLGKIGLKYKPNKNIFIKLDNRLEISSVKNEEENNVSLPFNKLKFSNNEELNQISFDSKLNLERKLSLNHTSQVKLNLNIIKSTEKSYWNSNQNIFQNTLTLKQVPEYNVIQNVNNKRIQFNSTFKHFWIINSQNHIYFNLNSIIALDDYVSDLGQLIKNSKALSFFDFYNNSTNNEIISFLGFEYKRLIGKAFFTIKLNYQNYNRSNSQFNLKISQALNLVLPSVNFTWDYDLNKSIVFDYQLTRSFPNTKQLLINNQLSRFNLVNRGNLNLSKSSFHYFKLNFRNHKSYGWSFYSGLSYKLKNNTISNAFSVNGIYNTLKPINIQTPNKEFLSRLRIVYNNKFWKATLLGELRDSKYASLINGFEIETINNSIYFRGGLRSNFIKGPNIDFNISHNQNDNKNIIFSNNINMTKLDFSINHEFNNWQFKSEYLYNYYLNETTKVRNTYNEINGEISYQKEDSSFGYSIEMKNLTNNSFKLNSSFSNVLFSEKKTFVFPKTILFKIFYKF